MFTYFHKSKATAIYGLPKAILAIVLEIKDSFNNATSNLFLTA